MADSRTDRKSLTQAFGESELSLRRFVRRFLDRAEDVDDILHDAFLRAYRRDRAQPIEEPRAFLFRTARNLALNEIAKARGRKTCTVADFDSLPVVYDGDTPERRSIVREELAQAMDALERLSPRVRDVFILRKIHGLKQKEIAAELGISESTVEKHIAKGLEQMAAWQAGEGP